MGLSDKIRGNRSIDGPDRKVAGLNDGRRAIIEPGRSAFSYSFGRQQSTDDGSAYRFESSASQGGDPKPGVSAVADGSSPPARDSRSPLGKVNGSTISIAPVAPVVSLDIYDDAALMKLLREIERDLKNGGEPLPKQIQACQRLTAMRFLSSDRFEDIQKKGLASERKTDSERAPEIIEGPSNGVNKYARGHNFSRPPTGNIDNYAAKHVAKFIGMISGKKMEDDDTPDDMEEVIANTMAGRSVLVIGGGTGDEAITFARAGARVFVVDVSPTALATCKKFIDENPDKPYLKNITLLPSMDAFRMFDNLPPELAHGVDDVYGFSTWHYGFEQIIVRKLLAKAYQLQRPGGNLGMGMKTHMSDTASDYQFNLTGPPYNTSLHRIERIVRSFPEPEAILKLPRDAKYIVGGHKELYLPNYDIDGMTERALLVQGKKV